MGAKIHVPVFAGEIPRRSRFALDPSQAAFSENAILRSGELRPLHAPELAHTFPTDPLVHQVRYAYRVAATTDYTEKWIPFTDEKVNFLKGPLVKDKYDRYYWTADNGENAEENKLPLQYTTRELIDGGTQVTNDNITGFRVGVPRPQRAPCVTTATRAHMGAKPHWSGDTVPPVNADLPVPGDWWTDGTQYRVKVEAGNADWFSLISELTNTVDKQDDLASLTGITKNEYVMVDRDPDNSRNGWYIAGETEAGSLPLSKWKHTGATSYDRQYSDTQLVPSDQEATWKEVDRKHQRWDGQDLGDFVRDIKDTIDAPPEFLDYIYASFPSEVAGTDDVWGWFWVKAPPATETINENIELIGEIMPEHQTEIVTRAYVYTYVNAIGEEGPPSDPTQYDALDGEAWCVHNFDLDTPDNATDGETMTGPDGRIPLIAIRIYRTITGTSGSADYFYVGEMPIKANIPTAASIVTPATFTYPKRYDITDESSLYAQTNVRHNDWLLVSDDRARVDGNNKFRIKKWFKAVVRDHEGVINEDEITSLEYTTSLTAGQFGYEWVAEEGPYDDLSYVDAKLTSDVGFEDPLQTYSWFEPPKGLLGLSAHPNGFFVAFSGRDLYFSVPYRPHAWPEEYILTMEHPIVNIGIFGTSIAVLTEGHPYIATGITPEAMSLIKYQTPVPCLSFEAVTPMPGAVAFPSKEGLFTATQEGFRNVTEQLMTEEEWQHHNPDQLIAARDGMAYVAFYDTDFDLNDIDTGFTFDPTEPMSAFSHLKGTGAEVLAKVDNVQTDYYNGDAYILSENKVYLYDPVHKAPINYKWTSKTFVSPMPVNFGALAISWRPASDTIYEPDTTAYTGSTLTFTLYCDLMDSTNTAVMTRSTTIDVGARSAAVSPLVVPTQPIRLPAGFKARNWWFEIEGNVVVESVKIAETGHELAGI